MRQPASEDELIALREEIRQLGRAFWARRTRLASRICAPLMLLIWVAWITLLPTGHGARTAIIALVLVLGMAAVWIGASWVSSLIAGKPLMRRGSDLADRIAQLAPDQQKAVLVPAREQRSDAQLIVNALRRGVRRRTGTEVAPTIAPEGSGGEPSSP